jgi:hypothetical protein
LNLWNPKQATVPCRLVKGQVSKDTHQRVRMVILPEKASRYPDAERPSLMHLEKFLWTKSIENEFCPYKKTNYAQYKGLSNIGKSTII